MPQREDNKKFSPTTYLGLMGKHTWGNIIRVTGSQKLHPSMQILETIQGEHDRGQKKLLHRARGHGWLR